jgi:hypothetical protein
LEINVSTVKYKSFFNQEGPTYTISKIDVYAIVYENGVMEAFANSPNRTIEEFNQMSDREAEKFLQQMIDSISARHPNNLQPIQGFDQMSDREQGKFLQQTDLPIYETFRRGESLRSSGSGLLGVGLLFSGVGLGIMLLDALGTIENGALAGEILFGAGQTFIIVSIPLSATGGALKRRAQNEFRNKYSGIGYFEPSLNLNFHSNGIGLAINF